MYQQQKCYKFIFCVILCNVSVSVTVHIHTRQFLSRQDNKLVTKTEVEEMDGVETCAKHPLKPVTSYCVQHSVAICITCLLNDHKDCIDHVEAIETAKERIQCPSSELERVCDRLIANVGNVKHRKVACVEKVDTVSKDLRQGLGQMRSQIVHKINKLAAQASDMSTSVLEDHKKMYEADIDFLAHMENNLKNIKLNLREKKNMRTLLHIESDLEMIAKEFRNRKLKAGDIRIQFHVSDMVNRLEQQLETFGELCVEDISEHVHSLYIAEYDSRTKTLDTVDEGRHAMNHDLFITSDEGCTYQSIYTSANPASPSLVRVKPCVAPPLPTMENRRLLSPQIKDDCYPDNIFRTIPNADTLEATSENSSNPITNRHSESMTNTCSKGDTPNNSSEETDNVAVPQQIGEAFRRTHPNTQSKETARLTMPLPSRRPKPLRKNTSWPPTTDININVDTQAKYEENDTSLTLPRAKKQPTVKHEHSVPDNSTQREGNIRERSWSNATNCSAGCSSDRSRHDSGIVLSQDLSNTDKPATENNVLKIPPLPSKYKLRKKSAPNLSTASKELRARLRRHETIQNYDKRKSCSETDLREKTNGDVKNIRAKEMSPEKEGVYKNTMSVSVDRQRRKVISAGSTRIKGILGDTVLDIPIEEFSPQQAVASAIAPNSIDLSVDKTKSRNASFITGIASLDGGCIVACDLRNNIIEMFDSYGLLKDTYDVHRPFGCCRIDGNRFSVTSRDSPSIRLFYVEDSEIKLVGEREIAKGLEIFGISYSQGFFCISCLSEVILVSETVQEKQIVIKPLERHGKRVSLFGKSTKTFFLDVQYALMEHVDDRFYIFTSDVKRRRVTSVTVNNMVVWTQQDLDCRAIAYYAHQIFVATDKHVVFLHASSGDHIRDVSVGIPRSPWGIAVDRELFPWLLVSGCGKTCSRQLMRIALTSMSEHKTTRALSDGHFV